MTGARTKSIAARLAIAACAALLSACGTLVNVSSDGEDQDLMLRGHDPVAYFKEGKPVMGLPAIKARVDGVTYRFASEDNRKAFVAEPKKYAPQYGGFCSNGTPYAIKAGGNPANFKIAEGRLFIFGDAKALEFWELDWKKNIERADFYWENEMKDMPWRLQSYKRWVFRVPHYKTGRELQAEIDAKKGKS